jgi:hypothetical protein
MKMENSGKKEMINGKLGNDYRLMENEWGRVKREMTNTLMHD